MSKDPRVDRRRFFREGLRELLKPLADAADPITEAMKHFDRSLSPAGASPRRATARTVSLDYWLRPPGALPEQQFRDACSRCGECVAACPAHCIKIDHSGQQGHGVPFIDVETMPCVVCDSLACMNVCPTGALVPMPLNEIDMGTAVWHQESCLLTQDQHCTICADQCPLGEAAITIEAQRVEVKPAGCIGCGICEHYCPTSPRSITIIPKAAKESAA